MITEISDPHDERLALYRDVKDRDLTGRGGLFMAEGKVVLERLFSSPLAQTVSVLTTPERLKGLAHLPEAPVYVVAQELMDDLAGFPIHRGYLALGRYAPPKSLSEILAGERVRVLVLSGIANTDNMGGLMRNAAAFGVDAVILDATCCDALYRKAIRVSVGGVLQMPHYRVDNLVETLRARDLTPYALSPAGRLTLDEVRPAARSAMLFGAEGPGLSAEVMAACTTVRIEMSGGFDSLNVATTSGIVLYQFCR
ncbi:TrmH family RNA methyltransferase [Asticcacaulis benevestitus]|uniref:RNA methyltransferase n=1 Tax=Asticcacaulis benevestitus DSM 16100 = ATCC BAA-896 TaxID=1121022 RepID=V4PIX5_9CAUL|nr:RNA methyltransferase [Asticcacaulis benevestitus]ESQ93912.1 RNA methyltransferase [Asticcacaulis benevestitus DSM 16100 = ATCC BAA-896]